MSYTQKTPLPNLINTGAVNRGEEAFIQTLFQFNAGRKRTREEEIEVKNKLWTIKNNHRRARMAESKRDIDASVEDLKVTKVEDLKVTEAGPSVMNTPCMMTIREKSFRVIRSPGYTNNV